MEETEKLLIHKCTRYRERIAALKSALVDIIHHDMVYLTWSGGEFEKIIYIASKALDNDQ